ncbi:MAG: peptidoglycan-binding domain-containing protein [Methyloceanibacter sp.]|uniref:peptidoglycan-binding domain-containing protein n=1 Tax=Methyloceanibacter sp. TaxID=1965321 RepID=UPI003D6D2AE1
MGVVTARLLFLAFFGLTGTIIYNALYLQEHGTRGAPNATTTVNKTSGEPEATLDVAPHDSVPVSTDLPPLDPGAGESLLVVRAVQRELAVRGYDVGQVDGTLSDKTRAAISDYQSKEGLAVTGMPSDELLREILLGDSVETSAATGSLTASDSIAANAAAEDTVKQVQRVLADLGYAPGPVDGTLGGNTARAISAFQRDRNIAETGRVTPELLDEVLVVTGRDLSNTAAHP